MSWDESLVAFEAPPDGRILSAVGGASGNMRLVNGQKIRFPWKAQEEVTGSVPPRVQAYETNVPGVEHKMTLTVDGAGFPTMGGYPQLLLKSTFADDISGSGGTQGEPQAILASGSLTGSDEARIVVSGDVTTGTISLEGHVSISNLFTLTVTNIDSTGALNLSADADITLSTSGAGDDIILDSAASISVDAATTLGLVSAGTSSWTAAGITLSSSEDILIGTTGAGDDITLDAVGNVAIGGAAISLVSDGNGNVTITASGTGDLALTGDPVSINGVDVSTSLGQWTDYTPTLSQNGTIGKTITYCRYKKCGREVTYQGFLVATAGGTSGQPISVSLPFTAAIASFHPAGAFYFYDAAPGTNYAGTALIRSTSSLGFLVDQAGEVGSNPSFAIASGDQVKWEVVYEATG